MDQHAERTRVVSWDPPREPDPALSGLASLSAMIDGTRPGPPVSALLGIRALSAEAGRIRMAMVPAEYQYNPLGAVHGGIIATLLDTVVACAVISTLPAGRTCATLEIKVNYLRAITENTGEITAEGIAVHSGRQVGVAEGNVMDAAGRLCATASATLIVLDASAVSLERDQATRRHRVLSWADPAATARTGRSMSGIDYLRALAAGSLPRAPVATTLGMGMEAIEHGRVSMTLAPGEHLNNPAGTMHGGMIATLLDSVMGCAVHSTLPLGRSYTTLEIKVNYIRAVTPASGLITGIGHVVHEGQRTGVANAVATDTAGRVCATASTTCLIFDQIPSA